MAFSKEEQEFVAYVIDLMQSIGPVSAKRMFGGHGIFLEGLMFGLIAGNTLYLKVDAESKGSFEARGLEAFGYSKKGKEYKMSYYQAPEEALEDPQEMMAWANQSYGVAIAAAARKRKKR